MTGIWNFLIGIVIGCLFLLPYYYGRRSMMKTGEEFFTGIGDAATKGLDPHGNNITKMLLKYWKKWCKIRKWR